MNRRAWVAALLSGQWLQAQQPTAGRTVPMVALFTPKGISPAVVGAGLSVGQENGVYQIVATGLVTHRQVECREGAFAVKGLVALYRNGLAMTEGVDFERTADGVKLTRQGYQPDDLWSALCR